MPPKKAPSIGLSRPRQKTSSSDAQLNPNDGNVSNAKDKIRRSIHLAANAQSTTNKSNKSSTSKKSPNETYPNKPVLRGSARKRSGPESSNRANESIREHTNPSTLLTHRREPAIGETIAKKTKAIAQSSKHAVAGSLDDGSGVARLSRSSRQEKEINDVPPEDSGSATLRASKSTLIDRRKRGSSKFGNASNAENSRRQSKRLSLDVGKPPREQTSGSSEVSWASSTEVLVGRKWRMFRVTPLHGFSGAPKALKRYGRELLTYLTDARAALPGAGDVRYTTAFTVLPDLRWDDDRPEALQVDVQSLIEGRKPTKLFTGILLSWGKDAPASTAEKCPLPLLLCTGVVRTMCNVHTLLSRLFDAVIQPILLSDSDFEWISAISMRPEMPPPDVPLFMHYAQETRRVVTVSVPALRIHNIWCKIHNQDSHLVTPEEVEQLQMVLQELGMATHCLELNKLVLTCIDFPNVRLFLDGHVTIRNVESVDFLLRYFCAEAIVRAEWLEEDRSSVAD